MGTEGKYTTCARLVTASLAITDHTSKSAVQIEVWRVKGKEKQLQRNASKAVYVALPTSRPKTLKTLNPPQKGNRGMKKRIKMAEYCIGVQALYFWMHAYTKIR